MLLKYNTVLEGCRRVTDVYLVLSINLS